MRRGSRLAVAIGASLALGSGGLAGVPASAAPPPAAQAAPSAQERGPDAVEVYTGLVTPAELERLHDAGLDHEDVATGGAVGSGKGARIRVEVTTNAATVAALGRDGVRLQVKKVKGKTSTQIAALAAAEGRDVFRRSAVPGASRRSCGPSRPPTPARPSWSSSVAACRASRSWRSR